MFTKKSIFRGIGRIVGGISSSNYIRIQQPTAVSGIVVQGGSLNFTPVLLVGGQGGTWSSTSLPIGASLNSITGQLTGTLSTLGRTIVYLTYTKNTLSDTVTIPIHVVDQIQTIAGTSISTAMNLTSSNRCYRLSGNITAEKSGIVLSCNNSILDLNGYTINYDNLAQPFTTTNGSFTNGTTGWDISGASGAAVAAGTLANKSAYNDGEYAISFSLTAGQTKYIETTQTFALVAGEFYTVSYWTTEVAEGDDINGVTTIGTNVSSSLSGAEYYEDGGGWRPGSFCIYTFKADSSQTVPLRITRTNAGGTTKTTYISKVDIRRSRCHGILGINSNSEYYPYATSTAAGDRNTVCNGTLNQVQGSCVSDSIFIYNGPYVDSVTINNNCRVTNLYGRLISGYQTYGLYSTNNTLSSTPIGIYSRDNEHGWLINTSSAGRFSGSVVFRDNTITHSIQGGQAAQAFSEYSLGTMSKWNTITTQSRYTNGFGLKAYGVSGKIGDCSHNTIDYTQGATDCGRGIRVGTHSIQKFNSVKVRSLPLTQEYTNGFVIGGAYAMQLEDFGTLCEFHHEYYYVTGSGGGGCFRVNGAVSNVVPIYDCTLEVNSTTATPPSPASCFKITYPDDGELDLSNLDVRRVTLKTNNKMVECSVNLLGTLLIQNPTIHIVNDAYYTNDLFDVSSGIVIFLNPTYVDSYSETEFIARVNAETRVFIGYPVATSITPSSPNVADATDTSSGYTIATLSTVHPNPDEDGFTYTIVGGADSAKFSISGGNLLKLTDGVLNRAVKSSYVVIVRVTDSFNQTYDQTITVSVAVLLPAPTIGTPTYRSGTDNSPTVTVNLPTNTVGQMMVILMNDDRTSNSVTTVPSGWTQFAHLTAAFNNEFWCYYKVSSGSEPSSVNFIFDSGNGYGWRSVIAVTVSGGDTNVANWITANSLLAQSGFSPDQSYVCPTVVPTTLNSLMIRAITHSSAQSGTYTVPSGDTLIGTNISASGSLAASEKVISAASGTGSWTIASPAAVDDYNAIAFVLCIPPV